MNNIYIYIYMHLTDAFIQRFRLYMYCQYVYSLGIEPTTLRC